MVTSARIREVAVSDVYTTEERELLDYSRKFPAFTGTYDFNLTFELLGKRFTRQVRVDYKFTPEWEYFDLNKNAPCVGWGMWDFCLLVLIPPEDEDDNETWEKVDLFEAMPLDAWYAIEDEIEERCKAEDDGRRRAFAAGRK
jgi:hypothetical protein